MQRCHWKNRAKVCVSWTSGCNNGSVIASTRVLMNAYVTDGTGTLKVTTFCQQAEQILNMNVEQIAALIKGDQSNVLSKRIEQVTFQGLSSKEAWLWCHNFC